MGCTLGCTMSVPTEQSPRRADYQLDPNLHQPVEMDLPPQHVSPVPSPPPRHQPPPLNSVHLAPDAEELMRLQDGEQLYTPQDVNGDGDTHGQYVTPGAVMEPDEFEVRGCDSDFYAGSKEKQDNHAVEVVNELLSRYEDIDKVRERQQLTEQMDIAESEADVRTFGNGDDEQVKGDDEQETNSDVVRAPDNTLQIEQLMVFRPE